MNNTYTSIMLFPNWASGAIFGENYRPSHIVTNENATFA